ncbi:MAG: alginate export family protein [Nitrospirae bacterium]|nr:alginate export family protein [Nitrospirota bacterium]
MSIRRTMAISGLYALFTLSAFCSFSAADTAPPAPETAQDFAKGTQLAPEFGEGVSIVAVSVRLDGSTGDQARDDALKQQITEAGGGLQGEPFQRFIAEGVLGRIRKLPFVASATYALYESIPRGQVVMVITAAPAAAAAEQPPKREGVLATGESEDLPILLKDDRTLFKVILNGGLGAYSTRNPFFGHADLFTTGNKAAQHPAGPGRTTWAEAYIEPGLGGITRLGDTPAYPYGAVTYLESASWGQDLYDFGSRYHGDFEQLYAGFIYDLPGKRNALNVSAGKQIYQLRQGFLISKIPGSTNLGQLGALWLGPRLAFDATAVAKIKLGMFGIEGIYLKPTEYSGMETNTRISGGTLSYKNGKKVDAAFTYLTVPRSDKFYLDPNGTVLTTREGLRTFSPSLWLFSLFGVDGLWFKGEYAYQDHEHIDMSAYAYAAWLGYDAAKLPWTPGISYRYTYWSGDDPGTGKYERYDPLLSGGQNNYVPGMLVSSVLLNANLNTHKVTLTAKPSDAVGLTLEYSLHSANELNNRGAIGPLQVLQSKELAQELDLFFNVFIGKNYYIQLLLAEAVPGSAVTQAVGGSAANWYAVQASLYWFF